MSTIASRMRLRAKLQRPEPAVSVNANSSQVRRLLVKAMKTGSNRSTRWAVMPRYSILIAATALTLLSGLAAWRLSNLGSSGPVKPIAVSTYKLQALVPCTTSKEFQGMIVPSKKSEMGFLRGGRINRVHVKEGDLIDTGELLAELDSNAIQAELTVAKTELRLAESNLEMLQARPPVSTIYRSRTSYRTHESVAAATAKLEHWSAVVAQLELQLAQGQLRAPYRAMVTQLHLSEGSSVTPDRPVLKIVGCDEMAAKVSLPASHAETLALDDRYTITVGTRELIGSLKAVLPEIDESAQMRSALFSIPELSPADMGSQVRLHLEIPTRKLGFRVPKAAVRTEENGSTTVAVIRNEPAVKSEVNRSRRPAVAVQRTVEVLQVDDAWLLIRGDLKVDDRIVAVMPKALKDNQPIRHSDFAQWRQEAWLELN